MYVYVCVYIYIYIYICMRDSKVDLIAPGPPRRQRVLRVSRVEGRHLADIPLVQPNKSTIT